MYDYYDEHNILVHKYGPHIFHTSDEEVWQFVNEFAKWLPYKLVCGASWDGKYTPTAFNFKTIDTFYSESEAQILKDKLAKAYKGRSSASVIEVLEHEDTDIRGYAEFLFENDYAPYTAKQWGVKPSDISPSVLSRVPLRFSYDEAYFSDKYEALPELSYTAFFESVLNHINIKIELNVEALERMKIYDKKVYVDGEKADFPIIYTGAIDELFACEEGKLPYRSLRFEWEYTTKDSFQPAPVVAYPKEPEFTRITEYKKLPVQNVNGSTYAIEYPIPYRQGEKTEPYYPVLTEESTALYEKYRKKIEEVHGLFCCGRLADFKYYNMDQAIKHALELADSIAFFL